MSVRGGFGRAALASLRASLRAAACAARWGWSSLAPTPACDANLNVGSGCSKLRVASSARHAAGLRRRAHARGDGARTCSGEMAGVRYSQLETFSSPSQVTVWVVLSHELTTRFSNRFSQPSSQ